MERLDFKRKHLLSTFGILEGFDTALTSIGLFLNRQLSFLMDEPSINYQLYKVDSVLEEAQKAISSYEKVIGLTENNNIYSHEYFEQERVNELKKINSFLDEELSLSSSSLIDEPLLNYQLYKVDSVLEEAQKTISSYEKVIGLTENNNISFEQERLTELMDMNALLDKELLSYKTISEIQCFKNYFMIENSKVFIELFISISANTIKLLFIEDFRKKLIQYKKSIFSQTKNLLNPLKNFYMHFIEISLLKQRTYYKLNTTHP